jgi:hypothetical protein
MRQADIGTAMNIHGDVVTDEMPQALSKVGRLGANSQQLISRHFQWWLSRLELAEACASRTHH